MFPNHYKHIVIAAKQVDLNTLLHDKQYLQSAMREARMAYAGPALLEVLEWLLHFPDQKRMGKTPHETAFDLIAHINREDYKDVPIDPDTGPRIQ